MNGRLIENWEREFIGNNYSKMSDLEMSKHLERSNLTVSNIRAKMGFLRLGSPKKFSKSEILFVKENYATMSSLDIGLALNRTTNSITNFITRIGLKRPGRKKITSGKYVDRKVSRMRELIYICETTQSPFKKDKCIVELKKLSGL